MTETVLGRLVRSFAGPFAFCGVAVADGESERVFVATADGIDADADTIWRAASISKVVTGQVARAVLAETGQLDTTVESILGLSFRAPGGTAPTVSQLASHQAGLTDRGGYAVSPDEALPDWLARKGSAIWNAHAPGTRFEYSNLGYVILAACAEKVTGVPFEVLAQERFLAPYGIRAGFNWWGIEDRTDRLPTFRRDGDQLVPQVDAKVARTGLSGPDGAELRRPPFQAGHHAAICAPQGGLRLSLSGALRMARGLRDARVEPGWRTDPARTEGPAEVFGDYGWGIQRFRAPTFYPRPLRGHFANAYGMVGGIWWDEEADRAFAMVLNGLPIEDDPDDDSFREEERALFSAIAQLP